MHEIKAKLEELNEFIDKALEKVNLQTKKQELIELQSKMQDPDFWNNQDSAKEISQKVKFLEKTIESWRNMKEQCDDLLQMLPEIHPEKDPETATEFRQMAAELQKQWRKLEILTFLSGEYDENNVILSIHAGTGGDDAQDFAEMLLRMYLRYAERMEFETKVVDRSNGDIAGIKSVTVMVSGPFAYGYFKGESGVHRLVRLSPFNSKHTRETSFALVDILPEIHQSKAINIDKDDLRIDVFRSGGKGGQSVNTTDSAVRITHIPTGVVVKCQNERSQLQNKEFAMKVLSARLGKLMQEQQAKELSDIKGGKVQMSWGNQIRSYVLHPYKMVKDHRTSYEESNPDTVLDGHLDGFIEAELKKKTNG